MKYILLFIWAIFLLTACSSKEPEKQEIVEKTQEKNYHFVEEFIYKKEQIIFFEKEYENILKIKNKKLLQEFANFYKKNSSYFINGEYKAKNLENKILELNNEKLSSHKQLLTKALSVNKNDAIQIYEKLAYEGNIFAQRELAEIYKYDNKLKSIFWYKKLIENNDIKSIKDFAFANLRMVSPVVVQDVKRAVKLYEKLDSLGEVSGLVHLGNIYEYEYYKDEIPMDKQKALKYFEKAAAKDYTPAQKKLVKIYLCETCQGDRYNKEKGMKLLNILVEKNDREAIEMLNKINKKTITQEVIQEELIPITTTEESVK